MEDAQRDQVIEAALESERRAPIRQPARYWWLSFCDGTRPKGQQFLGACIVQASAHAHAIRESWRRGCNPGGEVLAVPADNLVGEVPARWMNRLLTRAEVEGEELTAALTAARTIPGP